MRARVQQFDDAWDAAGGGYGVSIAGFKYESLTDALADIDSRIEWVAQGGEHFLPDAYDHLVMALRAGGRSEDARRVAIAKQRHRRQELGLIGRAWNRFLAATVSYGYRPGRAGIWLALLIIIDWIGFAAAGSDYFVPKSTSPSAGGTGDAAAVVPFSPLLFAADAVLPVVSLGQEQSYVAAGFLQWWYAISVLLGWVLASVFVAAMTAALVRD
jgi:hypothetical protein